MSVAEQAGLSLIWSRTPKTGFLVTRLNCNGVNKSFSRYVFRKEEVQQEEEELEDKISVDEEETETETERLAREQQEKLEQEQVILVYPAALPM